jgi:cytochrome o ubiquinol oxidase subunit 1
MYWTIGFIVTFVLGGMTGVLMAIPPADFVLHNSLFLIAHFHNTAIGGVVFGVLAGYTYWFPKAFGFTLNERLGKAIFWCWFIGFYLAFMPLYVLGLMGATRRMQHYSELSWKPWMMVALCGAVLIFIGIALTVVQLIVSIRQRNLHRDRTGDAWAGRTLEWSIPSPPPAWNFARLPLVESTDAFWIAKQRRNESAQAPAEPYTSVHLPRSNPTGIFLAFFAVIYGFAMIWHIWWLAAIGFVGALLVFLVQAWRPEQEIEITPQEILAYEAHAARGAA